MHSINRAAAVLGHDYPCSEDRLGKLPSLINVPTA
jgi:hypothetical protein